MSEGARRGKPKKKENFLRKAKRHGRKGNFGRGRSLSEEEYSYYMRVFEQLNHLEGEEKEILIRNFMRELEQNGQERSLASNQIVSRILDSALPHADITQVLAMSRIFAEDLRPLCVDPYASHNVQTLLTLSLKYVQKGAVQKRHEENEKEEEKEVLVHVSEEQRQEFSTFLEKVVRFVYNNLEDFVSHMYASHVVRSALEVCSGIEVDRSVRSSQRSQMSHALNREDTKTLTVPPEIKQLLPDFAVRFTRLPNLLDVLSSECGSAVLQCLLSVLKCGEQDLCRTVVAHLIEHGLPGIENWYKENNEDFETPDLPPLFLDGPTTRLLEVLLTCSSSEQQRLVFEQYFKGKIKVLVQHGTANFAVQRLLSSWVDKETFEEIFEETREALTPALSTQHYGVVHALTLACHRLNTKQASCMKALMDLMECSEPGNNSQEMFALLLLRMVPYSEYQARQEQGKVSSVNLQGALALQELLSFSKPIKVVNSLLAITPAELVVVGCDPRGSHVVDAFVNSTSISAKNKEKLIYRFKKCFTDMACSKHGSRVLESLWKVASIKAKTQICDELVTDEFKLKANPFGKIIFNKFQVGMFKRGDKSDWQELVDKIENKRKMFADLLNEGEEVSVVKEKKHKKAKTEKNSEDDIS